MRTRFAPSPTGLLHIGGVRTALYAWLLAKQTDGKFLLRIEDTDQERSMDGAVENILRTLHWAGLDPEEGVMFRDGLVVQEGAKGPYVQSERLELYRKYADQLVTQGHAYPCFCTPGRLEQMRNEQSARKEAPMYDRLCLGLSKEESDARIAAGEAHVLRLKVPREESITFDDDIRGLLTFQGHTIDDQVLLKSDGFPTYHLAHVVDDHLMAIDLVLRGEEWLSSLPKHILLFRFFGWEPPRYAHVPLLLNKDRSKLSKRQNDVAAEDYIKKGYFPETILNFLALLGWNPGTTQELFSREELIEQFSLERVQKAGAVFDLEKLDWLQGQWVRKMSQTDFAERIRPIVAARYPAAAEDARFVDYAALIQERVTLLPEAVDMLSFLYEAPQSVSMELLANAKQKLTPELVQEILPALAEILSGIPDASWTVADLEVTLRAFGEERGWKLGQTLWPLRAVLTGKPFSPGAFEVATALGKDETIARLAHAIGPQPK